MKKNMEESLPIFEIGPCKDGYQMGFLIGRKFSKQIRSRLASDLILQDQLLPHAHTPLVAALSASNRQKFPRFWEELVGTADGSGVPLLHLILLNFRKEILGCLPKSVANPNVEAAEDCSDVLVVTDSMAVAAHNEDANVALVGHTYMVRATLSNGLCFTAYTYAGELPSCAFGFNNHGLAFTLNSVPPSEDEIQAGGIGRNFISRDLLEATSMDDALTRICSPDASAGHSYNLIDTRSRRILNVETASRHRVSVHKVGATPLFHANMYLHLQVQQVQDENSISRQKRAAFLPKQSKADFLYLLGDEANAKFPIYMTGPTLYTLCTAVIDLDDQTVAVIEGNPKEGRVTCVFPIYSKEI
ncbi:Isopenicillin-N N-acyltransferase [Bertholletia excelsa]